MTQNLFTLRALVAQCEFPGFELVVGAAGDVEQYPWVQVNCAGGRDTRSGEPFSWKGRKWMLSFRMTDTEVVQTVWAAVERALLHEACELFTFKGVAIYDRHINVHHLARLALDPQALDGRDEQEMPL